MKVLDTDTLTLLLRSHERVVQKWKIETESVVVSVITRIEIYKGRFESLLKASNSEELIRAQERLDETDRDLLPFPVLSITENVGLEFDKLLSIKSLKKIGRGDLLIAAIVLANRATLVTRNLKDFRLIPGLSVENWAD